MKTSKRYLHFILSLVILFVTVLQSTVPASAASKAKSSSVKVWNGEADTSWYTGDKTSYDISTAEQLAGFSILVRDAAHDDRFRGITINLTSDIVLNDTSDYANWGTKAPGNNWDPIGKVGGPISGYCPFAGVFNGNGHTIKGMYIDTGENAGLFCYTSGAIVKDLNISYAYIAAGETSGAVTGISENSFFTNIQVTNSTIISKGGRFAGAGGIAGIAAQQNNISTVSYAMLLSVGVVVNPIIWFDPDVTKNDTIYGTYIVDSKVSDCEVRSEAANYASCAGGFVGEAHQGIAIYNGYVKGCLFAAFTNFGRGAAGKYGAFVGTFERSGIESEKIIKNCSYSGCIRVDKYESDINDASLVKNESNGWQMISGSWYYFTNSGDLVTNWKQINGKWYYFSPTLDHNKGSMVTGWQKLSGKWYYFATSSKDEGSMTTGWKQISGKWYYFMTSGKDEGIMATGWKQISGKWYYFESSGSTEGIMASGWKQLSGKWYFLDNGAMATGWKLISGVWYYFDANGYMLAGTSRNISGKVYKFNSNGACVNPY